MPCSCLQADDDGKDSAQKLENELFAGSAAVAAPGMKDSVMVSAYGLDFFLIALVLTPGRTGGR